MISVEEASKIVFGNTIVPPLVSVDFEKANGRILGEDITADRDFPPFDRVMMDGIALKSNNFNSGQRSFDVIATQMAGMPAISLDQENACVEVMTGAMLPPGADAVIRYEDLTIVDGVATVNLEEVKSFQNVHSQGLDQKEGDILITKGSRIEAPEIAILATVGKSNVKVYDQFKVAVISTGDELVEVDEMPQPYQIRKSNAYALLAEFQQMGLETTLFHINDELSEVRTELDKIINQFDVLILSGGVSKGKKDYIPQALSELGVEKLFHKVKQRPGKPFWFGRKQDTVVFALPGNPVSTFMCFHRYVKPWLLKSVGQPIFLSKAVLSEDFEFRPKLTCFLQVKLTNDAGRLMAHPVTGKGSGDLANLLKTDGFLELPSVESNFKKERTYDVHLFR